MIRENLVPGSVAPTWRTAARCEGNCFARTRRVLGAVGSSGSSAAVAFAFLVVGFRRLPRPFPVDDRGAEDLRLRAEQRRRRPSRRCPPPRRPRPVAMPVFDSIQFDPAERVPAGHDSIIPPTAPAGRAHEARRGGRFLSNASLLVCRCHRVGSARSSRARILCGPVGAGRSTAAVAMVFWCWSGRRFIRPDVAMSLNRRDLMLGAAPGWGRGLVARPAGLQPHSAPAPRAGTPAPSTLCQRRCPLWTPDLSRSIRHRVRPDPRQRPARSRSRSKRIIVSRSRRSDFDAGLFRHGAGPITRHEGITAIPS